MDELINLIFAQLFVLFFCRKLVDKSKKFSRDSTRTCVIVSSSVRREKQVRGTHTQKKKEEKKKRKNKARHRLKSVDPQIFVCKHSWPPKETEKKHTQKNECLTTGRKGG